MSYKWTTGSVRRGDIYYEDDMDAAPTYIDFGMDTMAFRPSGSAILNLSASNVGIGTTSPTKTLEVVGTVSGSSTLEVVGATTLGNTLNVSGAVTLAGDTTATSISGSGTLQMVGNTFLGGTLNVTGNADFNGTITCDDSITIDSITITDTEFGYLDGLTLGTVATSKVVTADASGDFSGYRNISGSGTLQAVGNTFLGAALNVTGAVTLAGAATGSQAGPSSFLAVNTAGLVVLDEPAGGGGGSPGGSDTQVQFNDSDSFAGDSGLTFNKTSNVLTVGGLSNAGSTVIDRVSKASGDSPYSMTATDHYIGLDTSGGTIQVDLQAAASAVEGRVIIIKDETGDAGTNNITVDANGSETIDGSLTQVINNAYGSLTLVCTNRGGKQWAIV